MGSEALTQTRASACPALCARLETRVGGCGIEPYELDHNQRSCEALWAANFRDYFDQATYLSRRRARCNWSHPQNPTSHQRAT